MARQYQLLKQVPGSVQVRFEDARRNLTAALQPLLSEFYPHVRPGCPTARRLGCFAC